VGDFLLCHLVDPRSLEGIGFFVQQQAELADRIPFDFCVYQLGFMTQPTPGGSLDASAGLDL
jgi:hypothetical protein